MIVQGTGTIPKYRVAMAGSSRMPLSSAFAVMGATKSMVSCPSLTGTLDEARISLGIKSHTSFAHVRQPLIDHALFALLREGVDAAQIAQPWPSVNRMKASSSTPL